MGLQPRAKSALSVAESSITDDRFARPLLEWIDFLGYFAARSQSSRKKMYFKFANSPKFVVYIYSEQ